MTRILHVGAGPLGLRVLSEYLARRLGPVVAVVDSSPDLAGRPLSALIPGASPEIKVLPSLDAVRNWPDIDAAIVATSSDLRACEGTFRHILQQGKAVVTTCEEALYPWLRHDQLAKDLHALALKHGGRLLGTGVNPGFLMDSLPVFLTAVCKSVRSIEAYRVQDASARRIPFQKKIGAGLTDDEFAAKVADGSLRHVGLGESIHFIAQYCGLKIERWDEDIAPIHAERDMVAGLGVIPRGRVAGVRQVARAYADDQVVIRLDFQAAIGQLDPYDRVVIHGEPSIDTILSGGVHGDLATSAITCNAVPRLLAAQPGLHTMATIPMVHTVQQIRGS